MKFLSSRIKMLQQCENHQFIRKRINYDVMQLENTILQVRNFLLENSLIRVAIYVSYPKVHVANANLQFSLYILSCISN
jgi:hypothetical protein